MEEIVVTTYVKGKSRRIKTMSGIRRAIDSGRHVYITKGVVKYTEDDYDACIDIITRLRHTAS